VGGRQVPGLALALVCWLGAAIFTTVVSAQAPPTSEQVFKNVQLLKGIPVDQFMDAMGMFSASLGYDCASCHSPDIKLDRAAFATPTPLILRARQMINMMNGLNQANFGGRPRVTCFTCHRGSPNPDDVPSLALQYADLVGDPNAMTLVRDRSVTADQVFAKYMQALGALPRVAGLRSFVARGTYGGFNTGGADLPIEISAMAPNLRTQIVRAPDADNVKTFDGRTAWVAEGWRPLPLMELTGGNFDGARLEGLTLFPAGIRAAFERWEAGTATIDGKPVEVLQGTNAGQLPVNFYFDDSGLLVRTMRWNRTAVGSVPTQTDFADYRDVQGVKMPFKIVITWTDGQNTIALTQVQPNAPIDASAFAAPKPFAKK
jgi:hypothetical protein